MDKIYKRVLDTVQSESILATLENKTIKLAEEVGEISVEVLILNGFKNSNGVSKETTKQNLKEEAVDAMLMCLDILAFLKTTPEEIDEISMRKIDKWLNNVKIAKENE